MSLPPGFLDDLRTRLSLAQVVGRKVMWDSRKSNAGKGDLWAPCPFHQEKTASFHVDDRKGFYYCFGCHAKGDAISFVKETENVSFLEAVEILAREAGMPMPERDPRAQEQADTRTRLADVMEQAVQFYRLQLKTGAAAEARAYLAKRGLSPAAIDRWHIGFAPDERQALTRALTAKGIAPDLIAAAGLTATDDGGRPYDRFRGRIIFPIRDQRGRAISLGGRAMDPNARAKYLNGPETPLFDKGRSLFNHGPAREACGKGKTLVMAEGYMDVIALAEAGFAAVAPLGTAVTEHQLVLVWRMADEPVIALDGDKAGIRAALRVVDLALPLLEAGKGLRFATLPDGQDPDDLIRAKGAGAMQAVLDGAQPMVRLLWQRETEGRDFDSPERKAALDKVLRAAIATIKDPSVRQHYGEDIKRLRWDLFGGRKPAQRRVTVAPAKASRLAQGAAEDTLREAAILATVIRNPMILHEFEAELDRLECADATHLALRDAIMTAQDPDDLAAAIVAKLGDAPLARLLADPHVAIVPAVARPGDAELARQCLAEELARLKARRGHRAALEEALSDIAGVADEWLTRRLSDAAAAVDVTRPRETEDTRAVEIADNGLAMDRDERSALDSLLDGISFAKGRGH
jgi:DNA primase